MKTAMQELLEYLQKDYDGLDKQKTEVSKIFKIALDAVMKNIDDLYISKEKEQIMEAYGKGRLDGVGLGSDTFTAYYETPEQYYQQTFKSDE